MTNAEAVLVMTNAATKRKPESRTRVQEALAVLEPGVTPPLGPKERARLENLITTEEAKAINLAETAHAAAIRAEELAEAAQAASAAQDELVKSIKSPTADAASPAPALFEG